MEILNYKINRYYIYFVLGNLGVMSVGFGESDNYLVYGLYKNYFSVNKKGRVIF